MPDEFVAIDLETTGLSLEEDRITEVGATRFDRAGHVETFQALVNPGRPIPPEIQELTSITDADVAGAPPCSGRSSATARSSARTCSSTSRSSPPRACR
jgi:DNA polymerase III epsilon subunit-like protein